MEKVTINSFEDIAKLPDDKAVVLMAVDLKLLAGSIIESKLSVYKTHAFYISALVVVAILRAVGLI